MSTSGAVLAWLPVVGSPPGALLLVLVLDLVLDLVLGSCLSCPSAKKGVDDEIEIEDE